ncbi:MAG TPA: plastocyanin/azurin family copper-binding protein [Conexibacter sp.]|nr:plastocyanin/azurin family copper-binding protein [Conexibacter sp.]
MAVNVPTVRRLSVSALALVLAAGTLAACGSSNSNDSSSSKPASSSGGYGSSGTSTTNDAGASSGALALAPVEKGEDNFTFTKKTLTAKAGTVTINVANPSSNEYPHGIAIEGNGVDKDGNIAQPGGTSTVTVKLKPGTYTFYCPVPEHEKYGMKGTLTVQ